MAFTARLQSYRSVVLPKCHLCESIQAMLRSMFYSVVIQFVYLRLSLYLSSLIFRFKCRVPQATHNFVHAWKQVCFAYHEKSRSLIIKAKVYSFIVL